MNAQGERLELDGGILSPQQARAWLAEQVNLDPIRRAEAALLVSDLVTLAGSQGDPGLTVTIEDSATGVVVAVVAPSLTEDSIDALLRRLLDHAARRWGFERCPDAGRVWFEVRRPGSAEPTLAAMATDDLLVRSTSDPDARDEVIRRFTPLALAQARRYRGKGIADGDLEQVAMLAMLRALDRYDPAVGAFDPFAARTVSGELKRHFRDRAWSVRVPRTLQERVLDVTRASQELSQRLGRWPSPGEIAEELDLAVDDVIEALGASRAYSSISLEAPDSETGWTVGDALGEDDVDLLSADRWHGLAPALAALPERERRILYLRFFEEMTQSEIAGIVGVSQMHVSRLLARALDKLRATVE